MVLLIFSARLTAEGTGWDTTPPTGAGMTTSSASSNRTSLNTQASWRLASGFVKQRETRGRLPPSVLMRWLRPVELPELGGWDLWRLRDVGGWGDAGRILGLRWEEVGGAAALATLGAQLVPLWRDRALGRWLGTVGLPNADAMLIEAGNVLRPVDLKWTLDTAERSQIAGDVLARLLDRAGDRLAALLPAGREPWRFADGLFVAPERRLNRLFLGSRANRRREPPIGPNDVHWAPVDAEAFFTPLPGWAVADRLAALEGVDDPAVDVETATRYYHLGIGVQGALLANERSLFAERDGASDEELMTVDGAVEARVLAALDEMVERLGGHSSRALVAALEPVRRARQALRIQLRGLERPAYRFGELVGEARKASRGAFDPDETRLAEIRASHRELTRDHGRAVRARGRELVAAGFPEAAAIEQLRSEADRFVLQLRARGRAAARQLARS